VEKVEAQLEPPITTIKLNKHVSLDYLNQALELAGKSKYTLSNEQMLGKDLAPKSNEFTTISLAKTSTKLADYIPLLVVLTYILGGSVLLTNLFDSNSTMSGISMSSSWNWMLFIELTLGILYLSQTHSFWLNIFTLVLMFTDSTGIVDNMGKNRKFECTCLGTILKVPLTQIKLYENLLMTSMALEMLFM